MSEEKPSMPNGGTDPLQRLASLKPSRDLSLGGVKPNKKVFIPNLNVARNKNKGPNLPSNREPKKDDKNRRDRKIDKNKNNRNGPNIIKSSGVFSEGLGSVERNTSFLSFRRDTESSPSVLQRPTIRVKDVVKIDKELEEQKIRSVMGESDNSFDEPSVDFKKALERDAPINLPMENGVSHRHKPTVKVKQECLVKIEPEDFEDSGDVKPIPEVKKEPCEDTEVVNLLRSDQPTLILLQLPDSLPGRGGREEPAPGLRRRGMKLLDEPTTSTTTTTTPTTPEEGDGKQEEDDRCRLSGLEEGRIGKLRVHRSGRVTLALGETVFEVCMGTKPAFHQEVVSMAHNSESRSANLISVGALRHKLSLVPHWETMFQDMVV